MSHYLTREQLATFRTQGYLDCGGILSDVAITELRATIGTRRAPTPAL